VYQPDQSICQTTALREESIARLQAHNRRQAQRKTAGRGAARSYPPAEGSQERDGWERCLDTPPDQRQQAMSDVVRSMDESGQREWAKGWMDCYEALKAGTMQDPWAEKQARYAQTAGFSAGDHVEAAQQFVCAGPKPGGMEMGGEEIGTISVPAGASGSVTEVRQTPTGSTRYVVDFDGAGVCYVPASELHHLRKVAHRLWDVQAGDDSPRVHRKEEEPGEWGEFDQVDHEARLHPAYRGPAVHARAAQLSRQEEVRVLVHPAFEGLTGTAVRTAGDLRLVEFAREVTADGQTARTWEFYADELEVLPQDPASVVFRMADRHTPEWKHTGRYPDYLARVAQVCAEFAGQERALLRRKVVEAGGHRMPWRLCAEIVDRFSARVAQQSVSLRVEPDGEDPFECPLDEFLKDNADDPELCTEIKGLQPGQSVEVGGGAAPQCKVTRVAMGYAFDVGDKVAWSDPAGEGAGTVVGVATPHPGAMEMWEDPTPDYQVKVESGARAGEKLWLQEPLLKAAQQELQPGDAVETPRGPGKVVKVTPGPNNPGWGRLNQPRVEVQLLDAQPYSETTVDAWTAIQEMNPGSGKAPITTDMVPTDSFPLSDVRLARSCATVKSFVNTDAGRLVPHQPVTVKGFHGDRAIVQDASGVVHKVHRRELVAVDQAAKDYYAGYFEEYGEALVEEQPRRRAGREKA
jgi:hypothetical protein